MSAFFSANIIPFMNQWEATGEAGQVDVIGGLGTLDTWAAVQPGEAIPPDFFAYDRGNFALLEANPVAAEYIAKWNETYGADFPIPDSFTFQLLSTWQMAKTLMEQTGTIDPEAWKALIETGEFGFEGPYHPGLTYVNPINHMANGCASVAAVRANESVPPYNASFDPATFFVRCMTDVLTLDEALSLTANPDVTPEAAARYYELATG
jgi:hypothetical protein